MTMNHSTGKQSIAQNRKMVVIIPALNEEQTIASVIRAIPSDLPGVSSVEAIVIDDGSNDSTAQTAREAGARVVSHADNLGVGAAFHTGLREALMAQAEIIVNIDGDGQFNPQDIASLIKPIQQERADFVTATRFASAKFEPVMPGIKRWGNKWMVRIINLITQKNFTDVSCGFRAYSREAALRLTLFGHFTYTQETFIDLAFKNITMAEVSLMVRGEREFGESRVAGNLWRFGLKTSTIIFRTARDYLPHYFFGIPGLTLFMIGIVSGIFLLTHYIQTGQTAPYRSLVSVSGIFIIVGFLLLFLSMLADMLHRNRLIAEEAVYYAREQAYSKDKSQS